MSALLPAATSEDPRVLLMRGLAASHEGKYSAMQTLAAAREGFAAARDARGEALCAAAQLIAGQSFSSFRGFADHVAALAGVRDGSQRFDDNRDEELLAHSGLLAGLLMLAPGDAWCDRGAERLLALLELDLDVNLRFVAGGLILYYTEPREAHEMGQRAYALLQPLMKHPGVAIWLASADINAALPRRDFATVDEAVKTVERMSDSANVSDLRRLSWFKGPIALARGEGDAARFHAARTRRYAEQLEVPPPMMGVCIALEAQAHVLTGDLGTARRLFGEAASCVAGLHAEEMRDMLRMVDAYEAIRDARPERHALLAARSPRRPLHRSRWPSRACARSPCSSAFRPLRPRKRCSSPSIARRMACLLMRAAS